MDGLLEWITFFQLTVAIRGVTSKPDPDQEQSEKFTGTAGCSKHLGALDPNLRGLMWII